MTFTPIIGRDYITRDGRKAENLESLHGFDRWAYKAVVEGLGLYYRKDGARHGGSDLVGFWPSEQYGPWTAYNGGGCPVEDGVRGQIQVRGTSQIDAEKLPAMNLHELGWDIRNKPRDICAYRVLKEPVHEAVTDKDLQWDSNQAEVFCIPASKPHEHGFSLTFHHIDGEPDKSRPPEAKWT